MEVELFGGHGLAICSCAFSDNQRDKISQWFIQKYNLNLDEIYNDSDRKCNIIRHNGVKKLIKNIADYIHPSMSYKFPEFQEYFNNFKDLSINIDNYTICNLPLVYKKDIKGIKHQHNLHAYDIEVQDNHNYIANNILVHNCKLKRSVSQSMMAENMGDTLDAFIIGFEKGNEGTSIENLISTLHFGIYLQDDEGNLLLDDEGNPKIHYIASVSGLSLALRETMTEIINGQVQLKQEYYNMVAEIDGQDISSKNLRFSHARLLRWRPDRSSDTCQIKYSFIKSLVM